MFYIVLFGRCKLTRDDRPYGANLNIGWTIGEEILFKGKKYGRKEICHAAKDSCVLGIEKKNLMQVKKLLYEKGNHDEFTKLEIVLRGNHLVKQEWK